MEVLASITVGTGALPLGGDDVSDEAAAEDLFILAAVSGKEQVEIVVAPTDFRRQPVRMPEGSPSWLPVLYGHIKAALNRFPREA
jgi:hypothetical protein